MPATVNTNNILHAGRVYRYKPSSFTSGSAWKESWLILNQDGFLNWYNNRQCQKLRGSVNVKRIPQRVKLCQVAQSTLSDCPDPPYGDNFNYIAVPSGRFKRSGHPVYQWFCAKTEQNLIRWLEAFATVIKRRERYEELKAGHHTASIDKSNSQSQLERPPSQAGSPIPKSPNLHSTTANWGELWEKLLRLPSIENEPAYVNDNSEYADNNPAMDVDEDMEGGYDNPVYKEVRRAISADSIPNGSVAHEEVVVEVHKTPDTAHKKRPAPSPPFDSPHITKWADEDDLTVQSAYDQIGPVTTFENVQMIESSDGTERSQRWEAEQVTLTTESQPGVTVVTKTRTMVVHSKYQREAEIVV